jgi:hypothetical protein
MTKGIFFAALLIVTFTTALLTHVGESGASFHLNRIDGAMAGANGISTIQYVELRSANVGQNLVGSNGAVICFFDSAGAPYAEFKFHTPDPSNGADGASILVGTAEFDAAWPAGSPDYTFSPANTTAIASGADTSHPVRSPGGRISFGVDSAVMPSLMCQASFSVVDSVAYGTGYSGTVDFGTKLASDLPTSSTNGLHLQGPICIEGSTHPCSSPRDNSVNYAIVDENATGNQPRNNANLTGPIAPATGDADGDGVSDASDLCPGTAPGAIVDAHGCSQAQVDRDADGICDPGAPSAGPAPGCTGSDNCPNWPNPAQNLPPWPVPAGDPDCDGFTTAIENHIGTDPTKHCGVDAWPVDFNNDQIVDLSDVFKMVPGLNQTVTQPPLSGTIPTIRMDLNGDGFISLDDIFKVVPFLNTTCAS